MRFEVKSFELKCLLNVLRNTRVSVKPQYIRTIVKL